MDFQIVEKTGKSIAAAPGITAEELEVEEENGQ